MVNTENINISVIKNHYVVVAHATLITEEKKSYFLSAVIRSVINICIVFILN